jgi:hypothetical protein
MDKATQIFLLKQKVMALMVKLLEAEETAISKQTILEFAGILNSFFNNK